MPFPKTEESKTCAEIELKSYDFFQLNPQLTQLRHDLESNEV